MKSSGGSICSLPIILVLIGCGGAMRPVGLEDLRHLDPVVKIRAIKWAGQNKIEQAIPGLVEALADEDSSVRFFAIIALVRITGEDHGFNYYSDPRSQADALDRWRTVIGDNTTPP